MRNWLLIAVLLTSIDQLSKRAIEASLTFGEPVSILPFFNLRLVYNTGAAFSFLSEAGGWQRWFFVLLSSVVCIYILYWLKSLKSHERFMGLSLVLILSGALGNLIDRAIYGKVTDFLDVFYSATSDCIPFFFYLPSGTCHWPTFNIADILITIGAGLLLLDLFRQQPNEHGTDRN